VYITEGIQPFIFTYFQSKNQFSLNLNIKCLSPNTYKMNSFYVLTELDNDNIIKARTLSGAKNIHHFCRISNDRIAPISSRKRNTSFKKKAALPQSLQDYIHKKSKYTLCEKSKSDNVMGYLSEYTRYCSECDEKHTIYFEHEKPCTD